MDLLKIDNPYGLARVTAWGTGNPFSFGLESVETLVPLPNGDLMIANDNNYPGNAARVPGTPGRHRDDHHRPVRPTVPVAGHEATVIAHRGASGYRPEHTLASYALAIRQCADVIEPDLVMHQGRGAGRPPRERDRRDDRRRDQPGVRRPPEDQRRSTAMQVTGWFTEDFTLAELRTLRANERLPAIRPENVKYDGLYPMPTLAEILDLARHSRTCAGRPVGVAPETKHPSYFAGSACRWSLRCSTELTAAGLNTGDAPVIIQSFETTNLKQLNLLTDVRLIQLINCSGRPWDLRVAGDPRTYRDLATRAGLQEIATYADEVGFCKDVMIPRDADERLAPPTAVIGDAHDAGLDVIGWTFRRENRFLPLDFRIGTDPNAVGDLAGEIQTFLDAGMDGFFTDNPDIGAEVALPEEAFAS